MTAHLDAGDDIISEANTVDNTTIATHLAPQPPDLDLPARDRHTWTLFTDWCTAHDQAVLPASPEQLARFLSAHPAGTATQRRRISVIDAVHHHYGFPVPGRSDSIRAALDETRKARWGDLAARAGEVIAHLPVTGWPAGLFARRDAMILTLAATGLAYTQIAALRICDVTADPVVDALSVDTINYVRVATPPRLVAAGASPVQVYRRWMEVLGFSDRYSSTHMLANLMDTGDGNELTGHDARIDPADQRPLLTPIDGTVTLVERSGCAASLGQDATGNRRAVRFQGATSVAVTSCQTANRSAISVRHSPGTRNASSLLSRVFRRISGPAGTC